MKRFVIFLFASSLLTVPLISPVQAGQLVKPGLGCPKINQIAISGGLTYKCVKSGKVLIWNKGSKAKTSTSSTISTPTEPLTFDDLIKNPETISYWAWKKSSLQISKSSARGPNADIHVGPTTKLTTSNIQQSIDADTKLSENFSHPESVVIIYYNHSDIEWAQAEWNKYALHPEGNEAERQCNTSLTCWGAMAEIDLKGSGLLLIATQDSLTSDSNHLNGTLEAHEYFHTIQQTQFVGTTKESGSYCCIKRYMPWWMVEGNAEFIQAASIFASNYQSYLSERRHDAQELLNNARGEFNETWFNTFLATSASDEWLKPENRWRIYDVGFLVNECLAALKGPVVTIQLMHDIATGDSWTQAFQKNFGITWEEAAPKISKALTKVLQA